MATRLIFAATLLWQSAAPAEVIRFDAETPGSAPRGWSTAMTHAGAAPQWEIVRDPTAPSQPNVLAQLSRDRTAGRFPLAIWDRAEILDGSVSVAFKTIDGAVDRAAGIVWRYQDANNYYIVRANALENNVVLYKVEKGIRQSIAPKGLPSRAYGVKREIPDSRWNTLQVTFQGGSFRVLFNGDRVFDVDDGTFRKAGKTGVWTKADSVTYFDDFSITGN